MSKEKMEVKKIETQDVKKFLDLTNKSWFPKGNDILFGDNFSSIHEGKFETLEVKEILEGQPYHTWKIVITVEDKVYLLKTSRELK